MHIKCNKCDTVFYFRRLVSSIEAWPWPHLLNISWLRVTPADSELFHADWKSPEAADSLTTARELPAPLRRSSAQRGRRPARGVTRRCRLCGPPARVGTSCRLYRRAANYGGRRQGAWNATNRKWLSPRRFLASSVGRPFAGTDRPRYQAGPGAEECRPSRPPKPSISDAPQWSRKARRVRPN
ncbi:hypothetical protein MRX96_041545 [Rhipicephalus microplus]